MAEVRLPRRISGRASASLLWRIRGLQLRQIKGYALRIEENLYWDEDLGETSNDWAKYLDHSADPNVHLIFHPERSIVVLEATRDIQAGEKLLINYTEYYPVNYPSNPWSVESQRGE